MNEIIPKQITFIDLCCGIGSFHYAMNIEINNSKCVLASDIHVPAKKSYKENYNLEVDDNLINIDYKNIDADILFSGNPCQSFSQIGNHKGFNDERGDLFNFILDNIVKLNKYKIIVFENVYGLATHDKGNTLKYITNKINSYNYGVFVKILLCSDYGIPQNRKRLFIICLSKNTFKENIDYYINIFDNILKENFNKNITLSEYLHKNFIKKVAYTIRCGGSNSPIKSKQNWDGYYVKDENDNLSEYRLTIEDMKILQGFPNDFTLIGTQTEQKKLLGNTIPTNLTRLICKFISSLLVR